MMPRAVSVCQGDVDRIELVVDRSNSTGRGTVRNRHIGASSGCRRKPSIVIPNSCSAGWGEPKHEPYVDYPRSLHDRGPLSMASDAVDLGLC